jgi:tRNA(fMet)-specific endonuclease VapC
MTGNRILLDTNIVSAWLKGEKLIAGKIDEADEVYIPIQVLGELYYGAQYSLNIASNLAHIKRLTERYNVLNTDENTAYLYGIVKSMLRKKGKPIPENDIWIATIAKQHELTLITRDKHFNEIDDLIIANW